MVALFRSSADESWLSRHLRDRVAAYALLIAVTALLYLPALGAPSLWDVDEAHNSECSYEMLESLNWIVPSFNYKLRVDKPALLYWLQVSAYRILGVGEFAARLPSALAAMLTVLLTYELARRMFDRGTGLLAGLILASALLFCGSAHFANPDALLNACTVLTFLLFWRALERPAGVWPAAAGISTGLGFLAKGPVALVLPAAVLGLYLLWTRQFRRIFTLRLLAGTLLFIGVAGPWFALVGSETHGAYLKGFFLVHNVGRYTNPMEGHEGPVFYHVVSLLLGFLPWSVFLVPAVWYAIREARAKVAYPLFPLCIEGCAPVSKPYQFLACWVGVYFVFFSMSQTKLPNYILPLYPAVAILVGRFLERWRQGTITPPGWSAVAGCASWALVGVVTVAGLLIASGAIEVGLPLGHRFTGLERCAWIGGLPLAGAVAALVCLQRQARLGALISLTLAAGLFAAALMVWGAPALDDYKAPRALVADAGAQRSDVEVHVACYQWYQPSLVFYCRREVVRLTEPQEALNFLRKPVPVYLFLPARTWDGMADQVDVPCRLLARHWDFYQHCDVLVVTNR
jgi:4-amino-4-deoxy-L-arabinose transferase-like glycosyltransferase